MKLVKEHINFKRGLDPKEAMNIGMSPQVAWKQFKVGDVFQLQESIPGLNYKKGLYVFITKFNGKGVIFKNNNKKVESKIFYHKDFTSLKTLKEFRGNIGRKQWEISYEFFEEYFKKIDHIFINETINFERGLNPKAAMKIGQAIIDKKIITFIQNNWIPELPNEGFEYDILNRTIKINLMPLSWVGRKSLISFLKKHQKQLKFKILNIPSFDNNLNDIDKLEALNYLILKLK